MTEVEKMLAGELYDRIIESYEETHSVKKTAEELGTSVIKVRRVLITEGLWSSATSRKILALWEQGMSTKEIAEQLHYTEKNVQAFLPYTKGEYGRESKSSYSIRSKEYRERNQQAAQKIAGALDGRFFAHNEEIDLCWRLRLMGRKIYCIPESEVYHVGGGTLPKSNPMKTFLNFRNNLTMLYKNLDDRDLQHVMFIRWFLDRRCNHLSRNM